MNININSQNESIMFELSRFEEEKEVVNVNYEITEDFIHLHRFYSEFSEKHGHSSLKDGWLFKLYQDSEDYVVLREIFDEDLINTPGFEYDYDGIVYNSISYLKSNIHVQQKIILKFFEKLNEIDKNIGEEVFYNDRYMILRCIQEKSFNPEIEIGVDRGETYFDYDFNKEGFKKMIKELVNTEGTLYIERALNMIKIQKEHLNLVVINFKQKNGWFHQYLIRKNYIEETECTLRNLLEYKLRNEEDKFLEIMYPKKIDVPFDSDTSDEE